MQKIKSLLISTLLVILSLLIAALIGEGIIRLKNNSMKNYDIEMWRYAKELKFRSNNPELGHEHIPNSSATLQSTLIRTNKYGLRGAPVEEKSENDRRIVFLGSSITLGWGVDEEKTMTNIIEQKFKEAGKKVEILNAGIGNYNAPRYTELFFTKLKDLKPTDIVVNYFLRDAEELGVADSNWFLQNSQLVMTLWIASNRIFNKNGEDTLLKHYKKVYDHNSKGYGEMYNSLKKLAQYAHKNNINIYLTMVPDVHNLTHYPFNFIHENMAKISSELGYHYVDLLPPLSSLTPEEIWAMPGDPHPNALGHKIMAETIYPILYRIEGR